MSDFLTLKICLLLKNTKPLLKSKKFMEFMDGRQATSTHWRNWVNVVFTSLYDTQYFYCSFIFYSRAPLVDMKRRQDSPDKYFTNEIIGERDYRQKKNNRFSSTIYSYNYLHYILCTNSYSHHIIKHIIYYLHYIL